MYDKWNYVFHLPDWDILQIYSGNGIRYVIFLNNYLIYIILCKPFKAFMRMLLVTDDINIMMKFKVVFANESKLFTVILHFSVCT